MEMGFLKGLWSSTKSIGKAANMGLDLGTGRGFKPGGFGSMLAMGGIGAGIGMASTMFSENTISPLAGGAVGGAVGALGLPTAGLVAGTVGTGLIAGAQATPNVMAGIGSGMFAASPYVAGAAAYGGAKVGSALWGVGSKMIDWDYDADSMFDKIKFTNPVSGALGAFKNSYAKQGTLGMLGDKLGNKKVGAILNQTDKIGRGVASGIGGALVNGVTLMGGTALLEGFRDSYRNIERSRMGTNMGVQSLTPRVPAYANNASATGDLVFALNANRRG